MTKQFFAKLAALCGGVVNSIIFRAIIFVIIVKR